MKGLRERLEKHRIAGLYRDRRLAQGAQKPERALDGRRIVNFCSNDYLGLANHPEVIAAFRRGADHYGVGSGSAHLITGHTGAHHALEEELADFTDRSRALLFSTGYMANLGVAHALLRRGDAVFEDRLNHASLLDAGLASAAHFVRYSHADLSSLESRFASVDFRQALIVSDGVFSMDGDIAPLPELSRLAGRHDAWLMVDDAHGLGVLGEFGQGTLEYFGLDQRQVPVLMGTLGKAFGTFGAFVAGEEDLIETLIQFARTYIYTTAPPPALAEATRAALAVLRREGWRRTHLRALIERFRKGVASIGLPVLDSITPIQPILLGDAERAHRVSEALLDKGFFVAAIRPPTVPERSARLRITLSAAHRESQVDRLLEALAEVVGGTSGRRS
ncbi:MAG: 8-amino-7-oxononanoate synthase [Pseudomonadota bacterium]|nr:8-amino-7-oxononanoate synthase [Pseudomonadota bacterium]